MLTTQISMKELAHDPAMVVISMDDYQILEQARQQQDTEARQTQWDWAARAQQLRETIAQRTDGLLPDSTAELNELREERADGYPGLY